MSDIRNKVFSQIVKYIFQIFLEFLYALPLSLIIWKIFKISQPHVTFLPINVSYGFHVFNFLPLLLIIPFS